MKIFLLFCVFYSPFILLLGNERSSYISDEYIPYLEEEDRSRTAPLFGLELGDKFLSPGPINSGSEIFTGAVWQPRLWFYGSHRSAFSSYDRGENSPRQTEIANRLDLYGNLQLTGTERLLIGIQPFNRDGRYFGHTFEPSEKSKSETSIHGRINTFFIEGDLSELFPKLDEADNKGLDIGFSIGRQHISMQGGLLINETIDAIGLTKNTIRFESVDWLTNLRLTTIYAWGEVNRHDKRRDESSQVFGLSANADTIWSTIEFDVFAVYGDENSGDLVVWGLGNTKRINQYNWTFRYVGSQTLDGVEESSQSGHLFLNEISWTPTRSEDVVYVNAILGVDNFRSIARDDLSGGPLGMVGLSFAAKGLGTYPSPLNDEASQVVASAIGYQMFFDKTTQYLLFELGHRIDTQADGDHSTSLGVQWQKSFAKRYIVQVDGFLSHTDDNYSSGARFEFQIKF